MKTYSYYASWSYTDIKEKVDVSVLTQLYKVGVYGIINNEPNSQFTTTPAILQRLHKKLKKNV